MLTNLNVANAIGSYALINNDTGNDNTALGYYTLVDNKGSNNIAIGKLAGNLLTTGSNNIVIGHDGVAGDANIIRIGTPGTQTDTFLTEAAGTQRTPKALRAKRTGRLSVSRGGPGYAAPRPIARAGDTA